MSAAARAVAPPAAATVPVSFRTWVRFEKQEAFEICAALALAEALLARLGRGAEASRMAAIFDLAEGRLTG